MWHDVKVNPIKYTFFVDEDTYKEILDYHGCNNDGYKNSIPVGRGIYIRPSKDLTILGIKHDS